MWRRRQFIHSKLVVFLSFFTSAISANQLDESEFIWALLSECRWYNKRFRISRFATSSHFFLSFKWARICHKSLLKPFFVTFAFLRFRHSCFWTDRPQQQQWNMKEKNVCIFSFGRCEWTANRELRKLSIIYYLMVSLLIECVRACLRSLATLKPLQCSTWAHIN